MAGDDQWQVGTIKLRLVPGWIEQLDEKVDVIVCPDDNYFSHGGGASKAIYAAARTPDDADEESEVTELEEYVFDYGRDVEWHLGDVLPSPAFALNADFILHAVTVDFDSGRGLDSHSAVELYGSVIEACAELAATKIAVPLLGAGAGGLDSDTSAHALAEAIDMRSTISWPIREVLLVVPPSMERVWQTLASYAQLEHPPVGKSLSRLKNGSKNPAVNTLSSDWILLTMRHLEVYPHPSIQSTVALVARMVEQAILAFWESVRPDLPAGPRIHKGPPGNPLLWARAWVGRQPSVGEAEHAAVPVAHACYEAREARNVVVHGAVARSIQWQSLLKMLRGVDRVVRFVSEQEPHPHKEVSGPVNPSGFLDELEWTAVSPLFQEKFRASFYESMASKAIEGHLELNQTEGKTIESDADAPRTSKAKSGGVDSKAASDVTQKNSQSFESKSRSMVGLSRGGELLSGTESVRSLRSFLDRNLPADAREDLLDELEHEGFVGEEDLILLEYCIQTDPIQILVERFAKSDLRKFLVGEVAKSLSQEEMAKRLLRALGFRVSPPLAGLTEALQAVDDALSELWHKDVQSIHGSVQEVAAKLERCVQVMLRFLCVAGFKRSPEEYFRDKRKLEDTFVLSKCSLGKLLDLLRFVAKEIEIDESPGVSAFERDFAAFRLNEKNFSDLPRLRNAFVHYNSELDTASVQDKKDSARQFFEGAQDFLRYLSGGEPRIFPHEIRIDRIVFDRWGRRTIEAINEQGGTEMIFTDHKVQPGEVYFMYPLSNPLRVDPMLVEAGELFATSN